MPKVVVFAPSPVLTVTVEAGSDEEDEIHVHAGGQGFWVARMCASLGAEPILCTAAGGEPGQVATLLMGEVGLEVRGPQRGTPSGAYVHDRRSGERKEIAEAPALPLNRHDLDELYSTTIAAALEQGLAVLTGPMSPDELPPETYGRLAKDLTANGVTVVADLSGECLLQAVEGGIELLKVAHDELLEGGLADDESEEALWAAIEDLRKRGARQVIVTRAEKPALAGFDDGDHVLAGPQLEAADHRGAGDSVTAGIATGLAEGRSPLEAAKLGVAAGALNVTRHGLATGSRDEILRLTEHVEVTERGR
jgi:1-phosphofructokinase